MKLVSDQSRTFTVALAVVWVVIVAIPLTLSILSAHPAKGLPLLGVATWFALLRLARRLSPGARVRRWLAQGRYAEALALASAALAHTGDDAWQGTRRLYWLNRRVEARVALGETDAALADALDALRLSADPETLGACGFALLRLNRYAEATRAATLALDLTRERSVISLATLAAIRLAQGQLAEGEALARAGLEDARALLPLARPEHYAACLATLCRAERMQGRSTSARETLGELRSAARSAPPLQALALIEEAELQSEAREEAALAEARALVFKAQALDTAYTHWYAAQPWSFSELREDAALVTLRADAKAAIARRAEAAPDAERVELALEAARHTARAKPAQQASRDALLAQVATLAGTLALLIWWTWRFFLQA